MEKAQPLSEHRLAIDAVIAISYWALNPRSRSQWSIVIMKFGLDFQSHQLNYLNPKYSRKALQISKPCQRSLETI